MKKILCSPTLQLNISKYLDVKLVSHFFTVVSPFQVKGESVSHSFLTRANTEYMDKVTLDLNKGRFFTH